MGAISISPSGDWLGNTGPWSSFALQIGHPATTVRVLPATSKSNIWAVANDYCQFLDPVSNCASFRGGFYDLAKSTTFINIPHDQPFVQLPFTAELPLGYNGNASIGTDIVGLGFPNSGGAILERQAVASFVETEPFIATGFLGLSGRPPNITTKTADSLLSPLAQLRQDGIVTSSFWGYNAGARYLEDPPALASLTFGGYDEKRSGGLNDALKVPIDLAMLQSEGKDLVVSLQTLSIDGAEAYVFDSGVDAFIDSVVPDIWLPEQACKVFEDALGLQWNESLELYTLTRSQVDELWDVGEKINFTVADPTDTSQTKKISLARAAFVSQARYPLAGIQDIEDDSTVFYFSLRRANDSSQVYLGHTFLQEAYLAVDYDRSEFYLSQANLTSKEEDRLVTIHPPRQGLSTGAIAGIAVAVVILVLLCAGLAFWFVCRPRWKKRRNSRYRARIEAQNAGLPDSQLPTAEGSEVHEYYSKRPFSTESDYKQELDATTTVRGSVGTRAELESPGHSGGASPRSKRSVRRSSYGFPSSPVELESRSPRMMHSRTASDSSIEPMSPLSARGRTGLERTEEEVHELP